MIMGVTLHISLPPNQEYSHYKYKVIFEKDLSKQDSSDFIESQKFIVRGPSPFAPEYGQSYRIPTILYVDNSENIYIAIPGRIEIFDTSGNSLMKFYLPGDSLSLEYYSWNNENFYLFFKKNEFDKIYL
jgi:hypothetical protein